MSIFYPKQSGGGENVLGITSLSSPIRDQPKVIQIYPLSTQQSIPFYSTKVVAGFPSPTDDHLEAALDLNKHLIKHPATTFMVRMKGDGMKDALILDNDILIVDRSINPSNGKMVVAIVDGQLTVRIFYKTPEQCLLIPGNNKYSSIEVHECANLQIWGIVTTVIRQV